ncbi:TetR/AcrR family transcriptional regulator [Terricaulis silvestris]|uniref:HTH-type transcriptional repressor KstR2 n=1 Tax=Terricaulis silvestris TaxID=2686094 RepID=A0A6I6MTM4_9CAUL|nr:TetR/AcrR family transcriptional regulator [Terricaulis silvestris]QGZ96127.1 HTH-type transcriptional repressor KstR2 [Terricaulis silvestris]
MRYEKGRKDASRTRIMEVAAERFRSDGIAASGLAGIMSKAGLTNGAFYPHFESKADLVRESVAAALDDRAKAMHELASAGGLEAVIAAYLSPQHRDSPGNGCALAALLPELARQPADTRTLCAKNFQATARQIASALPPKTENPESIAIGVYATLIGALQLARAAKGSPLSDRILAAGADAARALIGSPQSDGGASSPPRARAKRAAKRRPN